MKHERKKVFKVVRKPRLVSKMKDKTESSKSKFMDIPEDYMKCCRYCHFYLDGKCWNENVNNHIEPPDLDVYEVSESGYISAAIEEVLNDGSLVNKLMYSVMDAFISWKVSDKKRQEFMKHFKESWSGFADFTLKEELDEAVSRVYVNYLCNTYREREGIEISNPEEHCCKEWQ